MSALLDFALGPAFRATALFLVLGVAREVLLRVVPGLAVGVGSISGNGSVAATLSRPWSPKRIGPFLVGGVAILFAFTGNHLLLLRATLPGTPPHIAPALAVILAIVSLAGIGAVVVHRVSRRRTGHRLLYRHDALLGLFALALVFGLIARYPEFSPLSYRLALLLHVLAAEAFFVATPFAIARRAEEAR